MYRSLTLAVVILTSGLACGFSLGQEETPTLTESAQENPEKNWNVEKWLTIFSENWSNEDWGPQGNSRFSMYILDPESKGWTARFKAFQGLVKLGDKAIPALIDSLQSDVTDRRILAAQTLGYLGNEVPTDALKAALESEKDAAVKLYLIDSLGMLGQGAELDVDAKLKQERNRDIKLHLGYLKLRKAAALDKAVRQTLIDWDSRLIDSAKIGKPAPDFELTSARGKKVRLSEFRGKKPVVLVFIYGDT